MRPRTTQVQWLKGPPSDRVMQQEALGLVADCSKMSIDHVYIEFVIDRSGLYSADDVLNIVHNITKTVLSEYLLLTN